MQPDHCSKHSSNEGIERKDWLILVNQHWLRNSFLLDSSWKDRCSAGSNESIELMLVWLFAFDFELCPPSQIGTSSLIFNAERCCKCQQMTLRCPSLVFVHSLFLSSLVSSHCSFYARCSFPSLYLRLLLFLLYCAPNSIADQFFFFKVWLELSDILEIMKVQLNGMKWDQMFYSQWQSEFSAFSAIISESRLPQWKEKEKKTQPQRKDITSNNKQTEHRTRE